MLQKYIDDPKKKKKKRSYYEDELDGLPDYEPEFPIEEEQDENEIEIKKQKIQPKLKKVEKGITKSIKM